MNIGIDIKAFKNGRTGISRYLRCIMDRLQTLDTDNRYFLFECTPSEYTLVNKRWKKILTPWKLPGIVWQQLVLPRLLAANDIDILWAPEQICPVLYRGVIVTTVHDLAALRFPASCQRSNYLIQKFLFPLTIQRSTLLLPVSEYVAGELPKAYPKLVNPGKIATVTNGSPQWKREHEPRLPGESPFLFFAGNLEPRKNLGTLVDALEILHRDGIGIPLRLAGPSGWNNSGLHAKIAASPVRDSIRFLGYVSEEELKEQYRRCAAVVYPSVYEGFGLPLLEALSLGARVLTSRGTVMEEIAADAASYFDPLDAHDIARAIRETLSKKPADERDFEKFRHVLDAYSWDASALKLMELFHRTGKRR